jgi:hypothetical protein
MRMSAITSFCVAVVASSAGLAQTMVPASSITMVRTGWNTDSFGIVTPEAIANPAACATPDGYVSEAAAPGYRTYYAAALMAYALRQPVVITVHNSECAGSRPKIIGINLQQ